MANAFDDDERALWVRRCVAAIGVRPPSAVSASIAASRKRPLPCEVGIVRLPV